MPGMLFDGSQSYEVEERGGICINPVIKFTSLLVCESYGLNETRRALQILLKKHRRINAARPSLKYRRPLFHVRPLVATDFDVLTRQFKFGSLFIRPVDTVNRC